jgi:hypothetical protein
LSFDREAEIGASTSSRSRRKDKDDDMAPSRLCGNCHVECLAVKPVGELDAGNRHVIVGTEDRNLAAHVPLPPHKARDGNEKDCHRDPSCGHATSAATQEVITNPGKCAQFYPNANCTKYGPGNPYRGPRSYQNGFRNSYAWDYPSTRHHHRQVEVLE